MLNASRKGPRLAVSFVTLCWLFVVLPVFDVINGFLIASGSIPEGGIASPSQLGRVVAIMLIVGGMLLARMDARILLLGFYPIIVELVMAAFHQNTQAFLVGFVQAYKLSFLILTAVFMVSLLKDQSNLMKIVRLMKVNLGIVSAMLFASLLFGVGVETYGDGGGVKGYFASGNALGVYLGGMLILLLSLKIHEGVRASNLFILYVLVAMISIGTKTSVLMALAALLFWWVSTGYRAVWPLAFVLAATAYWEKIVGALSFVYKVVLVRWRNSEDLFHFFGSGRIEYVASAFEVFFAQNVSFMRFLVGAGASVSYQHIGGQAQFDTLETDVFDVFFMYGAMGLLIYAAFFMFVAYRLRGKAFLLIGFLLVFAHSALAGHVLFNGMNALLLALYCGISGRKGRVCDDSAAFYQTRLSS